MSRCGCSTWVPSFRTFLFTDFKRPKLFSISFLMVKSVYVPNSNVPYICDNLQFLGFYNSSLCLSLLFPTAQVCACMQSCFSLVQPFENPWTVAFQAPLSMGFSKQEHCSGLLCPPPGNLPDPGIEPMSPALQADSLPLSHWGNPDIYLILIKTHIDRENG